MRALALLLLTACGGSPFILGETKPEPVRTTTVVDPAPEAGEPDAGATEVVDAQDANAARMVDAQETDVVLVDAQGLQDATLMVDAQEAASRDSMVEAQGLDAGPDVDVPEVTDPMGCGPTLPYGSTPCGPYGVNIPSSFCLLVPMSAYGGSMPSQCQCAATYTCACLMAALPNPCAGNGQFVGCMDGAKTVTVTCQ